MITLPRGTLKRAIDKAQDELHAALDRRSSSLAGCTDPMHVDLQRVFGAWLPTLGATVTANDYRAFLRLFLYESGARRAFPAWVEYVRDRAQTGMRDNRATVVELAIDHVNAQAHASGSNATVPRAAVVRATDRLAREEAKYALDFARERARDIKVLVHVGVSMDVLPFVHSLQRLGGRKAPLVAPATAAHAISAALAARAEHVAATMGQTAMARAYNVAAMAATKAL